MTPIAINMKSPPPLFSVIVPTCGRPQALRSCLTALSRLDYPRDQFEVIVVDDGGTEPASIVIDEFRQHINVKLVWQLNAGPAAARNAGAEQARGEFLAFTDDDCRPAPGWLAEFARRFSQEPGHMLGGKVFNGVARNRFSATSQMILDIVYRHHNADPERARFFATANLAMTASAFRSLGGFDTRFRSAAAEDREFCDRCRFQGYSMAYVPDAVVAHHHELSFLRFCRQQFNYGRGACDFQQIRAQRGSGTLLEDLKFHLNARHWLRDLFAQVSWRETIPLAANLAFWQLSYTAGFFGESLRRKLRRHA